MNNDNIIIENLNIKNENDINTVSQMMYDWWARESGYTIETTIELIKSYCGNNLPIILVAKVENRVVGTISLIANDIPLRQDLFPVLTSLFVKEEYRNCQIGCLLKKIQKKEIIREKC